jgi:hypothetical protein
MPSTHLSLQHHIVFCMNGRRESLRYYPRIDADGESLALQQGPALHWAPNRTPPRENLRRGV